MTTVLLRNNTQVSLSIPNGPSIAPGKVAKVLRWETIEAADIVRAWLRVKAIEILTDKDTAKARTDAMKAPMPRADDPVREMGPGVDIYQPPPADTDDDRDDTRTRRTRKG